jgi:hypothetical protein
LVVLLICLSKNNSADNKQIALKRVPLTLLRTQPRLVKSVRLASGLTPQHLKAPAPRR